jgi:hypothetical protein
VLHELTPESAYTGTCDVPCPGTVPVVDCAVALMEGVQGTFVLTFLRDNGPFREFQVTDVAWTVPFAPPLEVTGSGTYTIGREAPILHRLVLSLRVGLGPVQEYDSGLIAFSEGEAVPGIAIISKNPECFHTVFVVHGRPVEDAFVRGDANGDGSIDLSDAVFIFSTLFSGGRNPSCNDAADADDTGDLNLTDGIFLLDALFRGSVGPPPPIDSCGEDPTSDDLGCGSYAVCGD